MRIGSTKRFQVRTSHIRHTGINDRKRNVEIWSWWYDIHTKFNEGLSSSSAVLRQTDMMITLFFLANKISNISEQTPKQLKPAQ